LNNKIEEVDEKWKKKTLSIPFAPYVAIAINPGQTQ
jgi:hypothetical protein